MKKCKNGFTLIELLLVIVLIISILGIAIVSVTKLSNRQKKNALEKVKEQVVTAAEQYFSSNEYLFEGIEDSGYGIITVGNLVKDDYLNKLTDPTTGKALNECDQVKVQRNNETGKFIITYLGENPNGYCNSDHPTFKTNDKAPDTGHYFTRNDTGNVVNVANEIDDYNGWYNFDKLGNATLRVVLVTDGSYIDGRCSGSCSDSDTFTPITTTKVSGGFFDDISYNSEMNSTTYTYKICNGGNCALEVVEAAVDVTPPSCSTPTLSKTVASTGWYNSSTGKPTLTLKATDTTSGISGSSTNNPSIIEGSRTYSHTFKDVAGNSTECSKAVKYDGTAPTCNPTLSKTAASTGWYNISTGKPTLTLKATDSVSGMSGATSNSPSITEGSKTYSYTFKDIAGNSGVCSKTVKYDATAPTCSTPTLSKTVASTGWYNSSTGKPTLTLKATDTISGISGSSTNNPSIIEGSRTYSHTFRDVAGNSTECSKAVKYDGTAPTCNPTLSKTAASTGWYNISTGKPTLTLKATDSVSGMSGATSNSPSITEGSKTYSYTFRDVAGNSGVCSKTVKYDATKPTLTLTLPNISDNSKWYNYSIDYKADASDTISGIGSLVRYWNKSGMTSSEATSTERSWNSTTNSYKGGSYGTVDVSGAPSSKTHQSSLSAEGHRKIRYTVCDQAGNCVSAAKDAKIDKTPPDTPTITSTPTICQVYGSGYKDYTATKNKVLEIVKTKPFKASSCTASFTYTTKFNGKLTKAEPGSFILYAEYKSSDALSGLEKTTASAGYSSYYGWTLNDSYLTYGGKDIGACSYKNGYQTTNGYPCTVTRIVKVKDKAGNVSNQYKVTYKNLSY